jgi:2-iminobutanoate/2-iminopropanoate deaminase
MSVTALSSPVLPAPRFRYSPCVKAGPFHQVSGMVALDAASGVLEPGGPGAETAKILANLRQAMPGWGLSWSDLVIARIFTTRFDLFGEINAAWEACFTEGVPPPARTSVGVAALPIGATVEIEFCFWREDRP